MPSASTVEQNHHQCSSWTLPNPRLPGDAHSTPSHAVTRFETFLGGAVLDVAILRAPDVDLDELLAEGSLERLRNAPTRKNLFFDEHSKITIVLKATAGEDDLKSLLPHLEIALAAHATDAMPQGTGNTTTVSGTYDVVSQSIAGAAYDRLLTVDNVSFVVWKATLHLVRPRARLQRPAVYFTANLSIAVQPSTVPSAEETELKPFEPLPANVLAPLNRVPEFEGKDIHLSADTITKVAPKAPKKVDIVKPVRGASKQAFPILAAMFVRIKSTRLPDGSVASLHLESSRNVAGNFVVDDLKLVVPDPDARYKAVAAADQAAREGRNAATTTDIELKALHPLIQPDMPIRMFAGDETILLYQIEANTTKLYVSVKATLSLDQGTTLKLDMTNEASERSTALQASTDTQYQWSRLAKHDATPQTQVSLASAQKPHSIDDKDRPPSAGSITIYFTAPATTFKGDEFVVKVKCVNSTKRTRHLTIVPVHQRPAQIVRRTQPSPDAKGEINSVAGIFDASLSFSSAQPQVQPKVVCLTPDLRIGPLVPGASYDTQVIFRATSDGVLELWPLRVIDLETKQTVDVWDLPDVVALEADAETGRKPARFTKMLSGVRPSEDERFVVWRKAEEERIRKEIEAEEVKVEA
ncbi:hypothetical protein EJ03DRAFT_138392 [Teratosphaeria nubilosa]|uniref:Trafficking protein particle complex II-specific subunit 65 IgD3 domain-containing protein n=1 Tax=Teratosphaeria nubilosa TaxID=161662 RepID=A0A6G1L5W2_9PEZI|nr:hypothetical protein EJ03DRAFT_138392 [Teratosphaeria nubilosa]